MALTRPKLTQLYTNITAFTDSMTVLHQGATQANVDVGFLFNRANGLVSNVALYWSESANSFVTSFTSNSGTSASDGNIVTTSYANLTIGSLLMVNGAIIGLQGNLTAGNLVANTGIYATSFNFANGLPFTTSTYSNANVTAYLPTDTTITAIQANVTAANAAIITANSAVVSYVNSLNSSMIGNVNAANAAIVTANNSAISYVNSLNSSMIGNVNAANAAIISANSGMKSYVDSSTSAVTSAWTANAAATASNIATLQTQVYSNANVTAYLPKYSGSIGTAVSTSGDFTVGGNLIVNGSTNAINNTVFETTEYVQTVDATIIRSVTLGNIGANIIGTGTYISGLNASNLGSGTVPNARLSGAYNNITALGTLTTLSVTGDASISGNLAVGNLNISSGNITVANAGSFVGNSVTGYGALYAGIPSGFAVLPSTPFEIATNANTYSQLNMQNINNGSNASSDYVVTAGNGTDSTFYGDFGIASNTYYYPSLGITAVGPNDTYLLGVGYNSFGPYTGNVGNVVISSSNGLIKLASGGANVANVVATVFGTGFSVNATTTSTSTSSGALQVAGGMGVAGNVWSGNLNTSTATATNFVGTFTGTASITSGSITGTNAAFTTEVSTNFSTGNAQITGGSIAGSHSGNAAFTTTQTTNFSTANAVLSGGSITGMTGAFSTLQATNLSSGNLQVSGAITPNANATINIGSTTAWFGTIYGVSTQAKYADLAENYASDAVYESGTVVVFGGEQEITISTYSHDPSVAGVISTDPAYLMNAQSDGLPVAFTGRVPCRVKGPVRKGSVLVTSDVAGVAMAIDNSKFIPGCVIGKALENILSNKIETIEVVVGRH